MRAVAESAASLREELAGVDSVLLLAPAMGTAEGDACSDLLSVVSEDRAAVVCVSFNESPDARIEHWRAAGGPTDPASLGFVVVGDGVRSATTAIAPSAAPAAGIGPTVATVSSPGDLTGLGIKLGRFLADWADDDTQVLLCVHTLTTWLQYVDFRSAYRFLHALTGRVRAAGGVAHFHLDPTAHDEGTVNSLLGLCDAAVRAGDDGTWEVQRRR